MKQQKTSDEELKTLERKRRIKRISAIGCMIVAIVFLINVFLGDPVGVFHDPAAPSPSPTVSPSPTPCQNAALERGDVLEAYFIDVGQGDCIFLRSPNGKTMLIDTGEAEHFSDVQAFLSSQNVTTLDAVVATHPHYDHIGSMPQILQNYPVGAYYQNNYYWESLTNDKVQSLLQEKSIPVTNVVASANSVISWDEDVTVQVLAPYAVAYTECNDSSIILRVSYGDTALLLMGDATELSIRLAIKALPNHYFKANVIKIAHHGGTDGTTAKLLSTSGATMAVISCGIDNDYGHPAEKTLQLLSQYNIAVYRTDQLGTIHVVLDGTTAQVLE